MHGLVVYTADPSLSPGELFNSSIPNALCQSAVLVSVYVPDYFSRSDTYCTREYMGMELLEAARLPLLPTHNGRHYGLIVPLVFRAFDLFPPTIKKHRQLVKFQEYTLAASDIMAHQPFAEAMTKVARYIRDRHAELSAIATLPPECDSFILPSAADAIAFIDANPTSSNVFPGDA